MTDKEILKRLPNLGRYRARMKKLEAQLIVLADKLNRTKDLVEILEDVTLIHNGVPLMQWSPSKMTTRYARVNDMRWAESYINAHNGTTYGVRIKADELTDTFLGSDFTKRRAKQLCLLFVTGNLTQQEFRKQFSK